MKTERIGHCWNWHGIFLAALALTTLAGCISGRQTFRVPEVADPSAMSAPSSLYEEVLVALDSAEAYARVEFDAGQVELDRGVILTLPDDLSAGVWLSFDSGRVLGGRIEFTKRVRLEPMQGVPMSFRELAVSATGEVDPIDLRFDSGPHRLLIGGEVPAIRSLIAERLRVPTDVRAVLANGHLFGPTASTDQAKGALLRPPVPDNSEPDFHFALASFQAPAPEPAPSLRSDGSVGSGSRRPAAVDGLTSKVREIRVSVSNATFHPGTVLLLHDYDRREAVQRTRLVIGPESTATIPYALISPRKRELTATIDLALRTMNSSVVTDEGRFDFGTGSTLIARGLRFSKTRDEWHFQAPPGSGYAELQLRRAAFALEGSDLTLKEKGSTLLLSSLDLSGSSATPGALHFSGAGRVSLLIESGNLHFNTLPGGIGRSYLRVGESRLIVEGKLLPLREGLEPAWRVTDGTATADIAIDSGVIDLNDAGVIICGKGTVLQSAAIDFDTSKDINFSGSIARLHVPSVIARLQGQELASLLRLDSQSSILIGGDSSVTLTDVTLRSEDRLLRGRLTASFEAIGGNLVVGTSSFVLADTGSRVLISRADVDTKTPRYISGLIDQIACVVSSTDITLGDSVRNLSLASGSRAVLSDIQIDKQSGRMRATLALEADATNGGLLRVGPGVSEFPIRSGGRLRATSLEIDTGAGDLASGTIREIQFATEGGKLDFAALSSDGRGSGFMQVKGSVALQDVSFPQGRDGAGGRGFLGMQDAPIQFAEGAYDAGAVRLQLGDGSLRGAFVWATAGGSTRYELVPETLAAEFSATLSEVKRKLGTEATSNPCALATGELTLSGNTTRFKVSSGPFRVVGVLGGPYVEEASGSIAIECLDAIALDAVFQGSIYIPCDGDAEESGAKTYPQWLLIRGNIDPGWRLGGQFHYVHGQSPTIELAERSGKPVRVSLQNAGGGSTKDGDLVIVYDHREMNTVDYVVTETDHCDRATVRWHKGYSLTVELNSPRLRLLGDAVTLSADLELTKEKLEVGKHTPSSDGLSWDGSPRAEAGDKWGIKNVTKEIRNRINNEALPALKAKVAELRFSVK